MIGVVLVIASLSKIAIARQPDGFDACAQKQDPAARLACFDEQVATRGGANSAQTPITTATGPKVATPTTPSAATSPGNRDMGLDARQAREERRERGEAEPAPPAAIVARVVRVIPRRPLISAFELDNGQVWEQTDAMSFPAKPQESVTIRHGMLGAFFLKSADGAVVRVHRLR
jgi:hypothetical protein